MKKALVNLKLFGYSLALVYAISFVNYVGMYRLIAYRIPSSILAAFFGVLMIGALGSAWIRDWGRSLLVTFNVLLGLYIIVLFGQTGDFSWLGYFFFSVSVSLFYNQQNIRLRYLHFIKKGWKSILVVDDDEAAIKMIRPILIAGGYSVLTALSGEAALEIVARQRPDLVLLDVIMPGIKGREVCRRIKENEKTKHIPVIFLTAKDSADDIRAEREVGSSAHLTKPVNPKLVISMIDKLLE